MTDDERMRDLSKFVNKTDPDGDTDAQFMLVWSVEDDAEARRLGWTVRDRDTVMGLCKEFARAHQGRRCFLVNMTVKKMVKECRRMNLNESDPRSRATVVTAVGGDAVRRNDLAHITDITEWGE